MAQKRESKGSGDLLDSLQKLGWFYKASDRYQVGLPDIIGSFRGLSFVLEVKAVDAIAEDGWAPKKSEHTFTPTQVKALVLNQRHGNGIGLGILICGPKLFWFTPEYINEHGQVDCNRLLSENKFIDKIQGSWDHIGMTFAYLWSLRMQQLLDTYVKETQT